MSKEQRERVASAWHSIDRQYIGLRVLIDLQLREKADDLKRAELIQLVEAASSAPDEFATASEKVFLMIDEAMHEVEKTSPPCCA
jgi:hypothetical protein